MRDKRKSRANGNPVSVRKELERERKQVAPIRQKESRLPRNETLYEH